VGEHLEQVRLATAEEAADPHRRLFRLVVADVGEKGSEHPVEAVVELALTDEAAQLPLQD